MFFEEKVFFSTIRRIFVLKRSVEKYTMLNYFGEEEKIIEFLHEYTEQEIQFIFSKIKVDYKFWV